MPYEVKQCPTCKVHTILRVGEAWQHDCTETPHRFIWLAPKVVGCTGCQWHQNTIPGVSVMAIRALYTGAHRNTP